MLCNGRHKIALCSFNFKYWEVANNGQDGLTRLSCNLTRWTDRYSIPRLSRLLPKGYIFIFRIDLSLEKTTRDKVDHQRIIFFYIKMTEAQISKKKPFGQKICGQKKRGVFKCLKLRISIQLLCYSQFHKTIHMNLSLTQSITDFV